MTPKANTGLFSASQILAVFLNPDIKVALDVLVDIFLSPIVICTTRAGGSEAINTNKG